jgi:hypothetical protein
VLSLYPPTEHLWEIALWAYAQTPHIALV